MSGDLVGSSSLLFVCLVLSFCFSATETAITAAGKAKFFALEQAYPKKSGLFRWVEENIQRALTVTLVGNNLVNIAASAIATDIATTLYGREGLWVAVAGMTAAIVIFCEILPKNIAIVHCDKVLLVVLPLLRILNSLFAPVIILTQAIVRFIGKLFGLNLDNYSSFVTREDVESIVWASGKSGALEEGERKMIHSIISFEETRVAEVMIPRIDMAALPIETRVCDAITVFVKTGHSRVPVFERDMDAIIGMLYSKDLLDPLSKGLFEEPIATLLRKPVFIPETMKTVEVLDLMRKTQVHIAIVVDEYGGTGGLVTLEDLLEEIVGDIQDEFDDEKIPIEECENGCYLVKGQVNLEDLSEIVGDRFDFEEVETVAGMVLSLCGNFPETGQIVEYGLWKITVIKVEHHRILEVRLEKITNNSENRGE